MADEPYNLPEDLSGHLQTLNNTDLETFEAGLRDEAARLLDAGDTADPAAFGRLEDAFSAVDSEKGRRAQAAASRQALAARMQPPTETTEQPADSAPAPQAADTVVAAAERPQGGAIVEDIRAPRKLNASLADAQRYAPPVPDRGASSVLLASSDVPGFTQGGRIEGIEQLTAALMARARTLGTSSLGADAPRTHVASLQREFRYMLGPDATPRDINDVLTAATDPEALVAAGGWCSPSEIRYDFYNIADADGMVDLPTVGINRGGLRWPISPSYADVVAGFGGTSGSPLWSWTETQDIAALTGTGQSGTKTCGRVPCVEFDEERLSCDGVCLTVGNLTEDAFPELIANYSSLLLTAHAHKMNAQRITRMIALSTTSAAATGTGFTTGGQGVVAPVIGAVSLAAIDYRDRYAMADGAVLEVVLPRWVRSMMRSDLRRRTGVDMLEVADARLMRMFDAEGVRVQWVNDYQVRGAGYPGNSTPATGWPTTVQFMIYAPGTFLRGTGLRLDLGVIRDSVLNATNDHTAIWSEECELLAKPGHESRVYTVSICADGTTGAADLTACAL